MVHLIAVGQKDKHTYAFDFPNKKTEILLKKRTEMQKKNKNQKFVIHTVSVPDDKTFKDIRKIDSYFAKAQLCSSFNEFLEKIN